MTDSKSDTESILLVDDEPTNLQVLFGTLEEIGCKKLIAKDGKTALAIARKTHPDLILLDIMMPGMDGFEVCRRLKSDPGTMDIPVIFLSALSATEDKVAGLNLGAVDYVTKPFQPEEVIARVTTHLTIHRLNREVQNQKDKLERELKIVSDLQRKLLPEHLPEISGLRLAVYYETSLYSGGDYYDVVELPNDCWGFLMADAAGHGAPAAVEMAMTCTLFRSFPEPPVEPDRVLSYLNRHLRKIYETSFVTAIYVVYDPNDRIMRIARAGQPPPMVYRSSEKKAIELVCAGVLPLGIESYDDVPITETKMAPGDRVLFYTDGITERFNNNKEQYSEERLLTQLQVEDRLDPQRLLDDIMSDVEQFAEGRAAEDDQALFLVVVD